MIISKNKTIQAKGRAWRIVHDGQRVITLVEGTDADMTSSKHEIEEQPTRRAAIARIAELELDFHPSKKDESRGCGGCGACGLKEQCKSCGLCS